MLVFVRHDSSRAFVNLGIACLSPIAINLSKLDPNGFNGYGDFVEGSFFLIMDLSGRVPGIY